MKIYLVGGAVRDELLNLKSTDRDWVVVGETTNSMIAAGFIPVGKDFPVFLHPQSKEEYALARIERKQSTGYHGFICESTKKITLEQDLSRRDLTINAIAKSMEGKIVDPFNGKKDIQQKQLRHVSSAFEEDPLRVLRVARFHAKLAYLGFTIAKETMSLMQIMSNEKELLSISAERIWQETVKALKTASPWVYFDTLQSCGAFNIIFREIPITSTKNNVWQNSLAVLKSACTLSQDINIRFAAFIQAFILLSVESTLVHEAANPINQVKKICQNLKLPKTTAQLIVKSCCFKNALNDAKTLSPQQIDDLFINLNVYRQKKQLERYFLLNQASAEALNNPSIIESSTLLAKCYDAAQSQKINNIESKQLTGKAIGEALRQLRINKIKQIITNEK